MVICPVCLVNIYKIQKKNWSWNEAKANKIILWHCLQRTGTKEVMTSHAFISKKCVTSKRKCWRSVFWDCPARFSTPVRGSPLRTGSADFPCGPLYGPPKKCKKIKKESAYWLSGAHGCPIDYTCRWNFEYQKYVYTVQIKRKWGDSEGGSRYSPGALISSLEENGVAYSRGTLNWGEARRWGSGVSNRDLTWSFT